MTRLEPLTGAGVHMSGRRNTLFGLNPFAVRTNGTTALVTSSFAEYDSINSPVANSATSVGHSMPTVPLAQLKESSCTTLSCSCISSV